MKEVAFFLRFVYHETEANSSSFGLLEPALLRSLLLLAHHRPTPCRRRSSSTWQLQPPAEHWGWPPWGSGSRLQTCCSCQSWCATSYGL